VSDGAWKRYRHRQDQTVVYEARKSADDAGAYEVRTPDGAGSWSMPAETFLEIYKPEGEGP
jgi:hypothetical protein